MSTVFILIALYIAAVVTLGLIASRKSQNSPEEYFLAGRGLGTIVLFMALFGTNATAFVLVGIPGKSYHAGIGIFGVNAPIIALGIPLTFWAIGSPARKMALRLEALTPAELLAKRLNSKWVAFLLFGFFSLYTIPYMVTAIIGASVTLTGVTEGAIPGWAGGLGVTLVALIYTTLGGMRATAWTNVLQGTMFLVFMLAAFFLMSSSMGGLEAATQAIAKSRPELLEIGQGKLFSPQGWFSWSLVISLTVVCFPHMFVRLMAGKNEKALKRVSRIYPLALVLLWVPAVFIGLWGAAQFPGLEGKASDKVFSLMAGEFLPPWLAAASFLAVLAAVMSTLDAQILTLSSMLLRDVLEYFRPVRSLRGQVWVARWFALLVAGIVYLLSLVWGGSVFKLAGMAFSGYVTLFPTLLLGVRWRGFSAVGAVLSILLSNLVLFLGIWGYLPLGGFLPVAPALLVGFLAAVVGSFVWPSSDAPVAKAFADPT